MALTPNMNVTGMSRMELCEFAAALCKKIEEEAPLGFRGGIYPSNVSVNEEGRVVLGPCGEGALRGEELIYASPELYWDGKKTPAGDVYSVGLLMYYLSEGKLPFEDSGCNDRKAQQLRMQGNAVRQPMACGRRLSEIITKALSFDAGARFKNVAEMKIMLENCMKNLFLNDAPCAETVFRKSDDDLSEIERMMVSIIESHDDLAEEAPAEADPEPVTEEPHLVLEEEETPPALESVEPAEESSELPEEDAFSTRPDPMEAHEPSEEELLPESDWEPSEEYDPPEEPITESDVYVPITQPEPEPEPSVFVVVPELEPVQVTRRNSADIDFPDILVNTDGTPVQPQKGLTAAERRRRRRRPLIIILLLCAILIIAALVFNSMTETPEETAPPVKPTAPVEPAEVIPEETPEPSPEPAVPVKMVSTYEFFPANISWNEAKQRCEQMGGHLAVIESNEELIRITALAEQNNVGYVWIGLHRIDGELVWEKENESGEYYYRWAEGEPSVYDGDTPEDYVLLSYQNGNWFYNDCIADPSPIYNWYWNNLGYVCEMEKPEE